METQPCVRCGLLLDPLDLEYGFCDDCYVQHGCTCCHGDAEYCGCSFKQTGELYYDCQPHKKVVRFVADLAPVTQGPYFRL